MSIDNIGELDPTVNDFEIVDTDVHTVDVIEDLAEYIDEDSPWHRRFEIGDMRYKAGATFWPKSTGSRGVHGRIRRDNVDIAERWSEADIHEMMDFLRTDVTILLGQPMLNFGLLDSDDARMWEYTQAYLRYMMDTQVNPDEGVYTMVPIPYKEPERAVELIDDWADEKGIVGAVMVTPGAEPPLGHHKYDPIYQAVESAGLPLVYHSGGSGLNEYHLSGYEKFIETHTLGFINANMSQLTSVVIQGVPERFPDMDIIFQESGIAYLPGLMFRLDGEYLKRKSEAPYLTKRPSEYMKEFYYGTQPLEDTPEMDDLEQLMRMMGGPDNLIYASDYPHWDYDPPNTITELPFLSREEKEMIFSRNAKEVFGV